MQMKILIQMMNATMMCETHLICLEMSKWKHFSNFFLSSSLYSLVSLYYFVLHHKKVLLVFSQTTVLILDSEIKKNWPKRFYYRLDFLFKRKKNFSFSWFPKIITCKIFSKWLFSQINTREVQFFTTRENKYPRKFVRLR